MQGKVLQDFTIDKVDDLKGQDIVVTDVHGKSSIIDCMVICTGTSTRHVTSIVDRVVQESRATGMLPLDIEGEAVADWIVVDLSDVMVHVMQEESRRLCELEKLWSQCVKLQLAAVGTKMPDWVQTGFSEYLRRFPKDTPFELMEIPASKHGESADVKRILEKEGGMMSAAADKNRIVTLDAPGEPWDTPQLVRELERWEQGRCDVNLLVGGPEGSSPAYKAAVEQSWSLSTLTLPHPLVRVLMAKGLYQAWSIIINHPYHRR